MRCCCWRDEEDFYDDIITTKSDPGNPSSAVDVNHELAPLPAPLQSQEMERSGDNADAETTGSDWKAVAWMRSRNESLACLHEQSALRPRELSEQEAASWERHPRRQVPAPPTQNRTAPARNPGSKTVPRQEQNRELLSPEQGGLFRNSPQSKTTEDTGFLPKTSTSLGSLEESLPIYTSHGPSQEIQDELDAIVMFLSNRSSNPQHKTSTDHHRLDGTLAMSNERLATTAECEISNLQATIGSGGDMGHENKGRPPQEQRDLHELGPHQPLNSQAMSAAALSDIGSEFDSEVLERYLFACRMLKNALIERESLLSPNEKHFLHELLEETVRSPTDSQLYAVETASATLTSDPLFQLEKTDEDKYHRFVLHEPMDSHRQHRPGVEYYSQREVASMPNLIDEEATDVETAVSSNINARFHMASPSNLASVARFDGREFPFYILGVTPDFKVGVLTPSLMESLRSFFPYAVADHNFWLKFSMQRDGKSLPIMLSKVRTSKYTVLGVETRDGHVFGAFCSSPWRVQTSWYGNSECFLWRLKKSRLDGCKRRTFDSDNEMEVYPHSGNDCLIQYCSEKSLAVGGGQYNSVGSPFLDEPTGIGFMIDGDLQGGETNSCATFNNPRLASRESRSHNEFDIAHLVSAN